MDYYGSWREVRRVTIKREYSRQVLLPFEKEVYNRIPLKQPIVVQRKNIHREITKRAVMMANPYFKQLLIDRYKVYTDALNKKLTYKEYVEAVKQWYIFYGYVDKGGEISTWVAIRERERDWKTNNPDDEWRTPEYRDKKSHHGQAKWQTDKERKQKADWKKTPEGIASTKRSREKAKLARMNKVGK